MSKELQILLVEDSTADAELIEHELRKADFKFSLQQVWNGADFLQALRDKPPDLVLADYSMPNFSGMQALALLQAECPTVPFITVSGTIGEERAVQVLREGAVDFVSKLRLARLVPSIHRALREVEQHAERKRMEASLRDKESRFRAVFEGAATGIAVEDLDGRILESNLALQQMLGYTADELQRLTRRDFSHSHDHEEDTNHFKRLLSGESNFYQKEKRFVRKDGRIIWGRLTVSMIRDGEGRPQFPITLVEDITERRRAEEALQQHAAIVDSSYDAIISKTFDGIIFSWNPGAERLYGYASVEANGRSISMLVPPDREEELTRTLEHTRRGERVENFETVRLHKSGRLIHVSMATSPLRDAGGKIVGVATISRDITERKRAEEALRESEENYRRLVELAPDAILILSEGKYVYLNSAGLKLFGATTPEQIIGRPVLGFVQPDAHGIVTERMRQLQEGREVPLLEETFRRLDGSVVQVETTAIPFVYRGKPAAQMVVRDITERKRAEEALRQSEARLARAQQLAHLGSWEHDFATDVLAWSDETCRIFGVTPGQFAGTFDAFMEFVHPDDREQLRRNSTEALRTGKPYNMDHRIVLANGEIKTVNEQGEVFFDKHGKPERFAGTVQDITARKKAEVRIAALSNLGQRLSSAITAKDAAEIIVDVADHLFGWDSCSLDLCSPDQKTFNSILSKDVIDGRRRDVPPPYLNAAPSARMRQVIEKGALLILRHEPLVPSEEFDPFGDVSRPSASLLFVPVRNGPKIVGVLSIRSYSRQAYNQDDLNTLQALADHCGGALERIRAESENQKLAAFPQFNPNPVLELAANGAVNYFNDAAQQMAESLGRKHPSEFLPPDTPGIVRRCLASGQSSLRNETMVQNRTISSSFFPVPAIGVVHCYAGDITDRQNLEAQLRQSQKMESVGQLAGGIAHDFNNILTVIQGHTALLSLALDLPKSAAESAQQINLAADRAVNLTRQLLTFSRRQIIQPKNLDLNEVVNNMTKMLRRLLGEDITLQVNYGPSLPLVQADPGMMEQVLLNLSVNARDAMPKGGRLFINTSVVSIDDEYLRHSSEARPGEHVCLTVKDTGVGIAPENLQRIFEPFFTTKDVGKGTGLGLATVYGIVQQHHGWIKVTSKLNQETSFQIFLSAVAGNAEATEIVEPEGQPRGGKETILVVEDEMPLRILVRNVLERYGYDVLEAGSGILALPVWREHKDRISLLLTDMVMPHGMSGRQLAERLLADKPQLKVIYSSGYSLAVVGSDMVLREGLNFLQKPYHPRKLALAVRDCLDN